MQSRYKSTRSVIALLLVAVMIIGFSATLYKIQVQDHEYYAAQNNTVKTYKVAIEAARGEIVDRNGNALVTNRETNSIILTLPTSLPLRKTTSATPFCKISLRCFRKTARNTPKICP